MGKDEIEGLRSDGQRQRERETQIQRERET
jgi:hypothetical protein